jgi:hypothetical protein
LRDKNSTEGLSQAFPRERRSPSPASTPSGQVKAEKLQNENVSGLIAAAAPQ